MVNPASRPEFRHTCPACNRSVRPGYKFCEVCGTRIPELATCSRCGTQFVHPEKFCDLCGAPVILPEIPGPDTDEAPEPEGEQIPEPGADDVPEPDEEEIPEPAEEETPESPEDELPEPDTDELLEQYGKEYGDEETLESFHKPKPASPLHHEAKTPARGPVLPGRGSSETVDDALFLLDKAPVPAKPPVNRIWIIGGGILLTVILAVFYFIGLPMFTGSGGLDSLINPTPAEITPLPEQTIAGTPSPTLTVTPATGSRAFVPLPTQQIPTDQKFSFQVRKNPLTSRIQVIFTGSAGEGGIISADIKVTHRDGSVASGSILPLKGVTEIILDGTKETDRVEIIARMSTGETYRVYDDLVPL
jgi:hypothetical protein